MKTYGTGSRTRLPVIAAALVAAALYPSMASAQPGSWSQAGTGAVWNWSTPTNWTGNQVADGAANLATFNTAGLSTGVLINLDTPRTIGSLLFDNPTNGFGWSIQGTNTLTLGGASPTVTVNNTGAAAGSVITASISTPIAGTAGFTKAGAGTLRMDGNNTGLSGVITVSGGVLGATSLSGSNPLGTASINLAGGTLRLGNGNGANQIMVAQAGATFASITATMDGGTSLANWTWYATNQNPAFPLTGLPMGQTVTSAVNPSYSYALPNPTLGVNNSILLDTGHTSSRVVLATPTSGLSTISFLTSSGNAGSPVPTVTATIHYTDGTPDATGLVFSSPDWFTGAGAAISGSGQISAIGYRNITNPPAITGLPYLVDAAITNPSPSSTIGSIDLNWTVGSSATAHTIILAAGGPNGPIPLAAPNGAQTFTNSVAVTADSTIDVQTSAGSALGNVTIGTNTLSVTSGFQANPALTVGAVAMSGNPTFNVGAGINTTTSGALSDGGILRTVTKTGAGTLSVAGAAPGLQAGTIVTVNAGTLSLNNATGFGSSPAVTINAGTVNLLAGTNPAFGSLAGTGTLILNGNTATVGNAVSTTFSGSVRDGSAPGQLSKVAGNTLTLTGASTYSGGTTINAGVVSALSGALGTGVVKLAGGTLAVQPNPAITISGFGGNGAGWTGNGGVFSFPSPDVLQLTPAAGGTTSFWYNTLLPTRPFTTTFTVTNAIAAAADGLTVGFQNQGLTALGGGGGSLGWAGITPSVALDLDIYGPNTSSGAGSGAAIRTGGVVTNPVPVTGSVNIGAQNNPTVITFSYDGANEHANFVQGTNTFTMVPGPTNNTAINIGSVVGGSGIFGFTGATGGVLSQLQISNFTFNSPIAPATYVNAVNVTQSSVIQVTAPTGVPIVTMGPLTMAAGTTLTINPDPANAAGAPFGLVFGGTTLNGANTISEASNGSVALGPVNSGTSPASLTMVGGASLTTGGGTITGGLNLGTSNMSMGGASLSVGSLTGTSGTLAGNGGTAASPIVLTIGSDNTSPASPYGGSIVDGTGVLALVKLGAGTLTLSGTNTYSGGTSVLDGTLAVATDAALGSGPINLTNLATLSYSSNTTTSKSYTLQGGTLAVSAGATLTVNGGTIAGGFLNGSGTFATDPTNGARFANVTSAGSVTITSNSPSDRFINFTNGAKLNVAPGVNATGVSTLVNLNGFTNQGSGIVTVGAGAEISVGNFQSYGVLNVAPATVSGQVTLITNRSTAPLGFNGGSRTFVGLPGQTSAAIDLHGQNLVIAGGLFVNNGFMLDQVSTGTSIIVDYGGLYKGAGTTLVNIITQNGGKVQAGNSPGPSSFGQLTIGPGSFNNFGWQINDAGPSSSFPSAPGVGGPTPPPAPAAQVVSGWSQLQANKIASPLPPFTPSSGDLMWNASATPGNQFTFSLETLLGPTTPVGQSPDGPMADFDPTKAYVWPFLTWAGNYSGPTTDSALTADTLFDTSQFANSIAGPGGPGVFSLHFDGTNKAIDLLFTPVPVPEPGTLALGSLAGLGLGWLARRRKAKQVASQATA